MNLLNVWIAKPLSKAEILERIRSDQTPRSLAGCVRQGCVTELVPEEVSAEVEGIRHEHKVSEGSHVGNDSHGQ